LSAPPPPIIKNSTLAIGVIAERIGLICDKFPVNTDNPPGPQKPVKGFCGGCIAFGRDLEDFILHGVILL